MSAYPHPEHAYLRVHHSLGQGDFCTFDGVDEITEEKIAEIKKIMLDLVEKDVPLKKYSIKTSEAREMFHRYNMKNKEQLSNIVPAQTLTFTIWMSARIISTVTWFHPQATLNTSIF